MKRATNAVADGRAACRHSSALRRTFKQLRRDALDSRLASAERVARVPARAAFDSDLPGD